MKEKNCFNSVAFLGEPSPEHFEAVIHSIRERVFTVDREWRITCSNRAAEEITGIPSSEALGRHCYEVHRSNIFSRCPGMMGRETQSRLQKNDGKSRILVI